MKKDLKLAMEVRKDLKEDEKGTGAFWDLSLDIAESENPQELIYNYLVAFEELIKEK
jgi:hypothetical protein